MQQVIAFIIFYLKLATMPLIDGVPPLGPRAKILNFLYNLLAKISYYSSNRWGLFPDSAATFLYNLLVKISYNNTVCL
jgi:hypothetical protein